MPAAKMLAVTITVVLPMLARAQTPPPSFNATIVNTTARPVPVTVQGGLTVSGTPNVNVTNTTPIPVSAAVPQPFQRTVVAPYNTPSVVTTVPAGKRLVVEFFSSEVFGTAMPNRFFVSVAPNPAEPGSVTFTHFIAPPSSPSIATAQPTLLYVESGQALVVNGAVNGASGDCCFISVSGHYTDTN